MRRLRLDRSPAIAITTVALVVLAACSRSPAPAAPAGQATPTKPVAVNAAPVKRTDITSTLSYTGDVKAQATLNVVPKVTGRIEKLLVDLGANVKQGDVIAELEKDQQNLQVRQAEAAVAAAQQRHRQDGLHANGAHLGARSGPTLEILDDDGAALGNAHRDA